MTVLIAPSMLASDFARIGEELAALERAGADWIHLDVMDGHFVPNISFGPAIIKAMRPHTRLPFDVHLMVAPVDPFIAAVAEAGADVISVHVEAGPHVHRTVQAIRALGLKAGVVLNPATPHDAVAYLLDDVDLVLVMGVNPGFGGQSFIPATLDKVRRVRAMIGDRPIRVEVDGGVSADNAGLLAAAGADVLVAGTGIFRGGSEAAYRDNIAAIRAGADAGARR
jgi:ribulose-phosphate 3-epimerase